MAPMTTIALCRVIKLQEKSWGRGSLIGYFHELSQAVLKSFIYLYAKKKVRISRNEQAILTLP